MKELYYISKNKLEWREVPDPILKSTKEAIVRPIVAGRCDGDMVFLAHNYTLPIKAGVALNYLDPILPCVLGANPFKGPIAVGHECVAEIVSLGEEVKQFKVGQKVIVPWAISCGHCEYCNQGLTSHCIAHPETTLSAYGFGHAAGTWGGMITDLLQVPYADAMLVAVPEDIDPVHLGSASDNIPDGWRTVAPQLQRYPNAPVLVVGGGAKSIGLYASGIAVALGASKVDYIDHDKTRLELAGKMGANPIQIPKKASSWFRKHAPTIRGNYTIAVDASASVPGLNYALRSLTPGGICTSVGYYFQKCTCLPLMQMYMNGTTFHTGISHPRAHLPALLELIQSKKFKPEIVTTLVADWDDAPRAYLEEGTKIIIRR